MPARASSIFLKNFEEYNFDLNFGKINQFIFLEYMCLLGHMRYQFKCQVSSWSATIPQRLRLLNRGNILKVEIYNVEVHLTW